MKRFITAAFLIFAFVSAAFAGSISPSSAEWDNTDGKAESLIFEITDIGDVTALEFVEGTSRVIFSTDEFTFDGGKLTILNTALAKTPNGTYTMKATTANAYKETVTVSKPILADMTFSLPDFTGVDSLTFKPATGMINFDPSEFIFDNTTKTLTIKKEAFAGEIVADGVYEMKVTENIGEETAEVVIKGNPEKQQEEEKQEEQKQEEQEEKKNNGGGSGGGCNAGFGAFALLGVLGMFYKKKNRR